MARSVPLVRSEIGKRLTAVSSFSRVWKGHDREEGSYRGWCLGQAHVGTHPSYVYAIAVIPRSLLCCGKTPRESAVCLRKSGSKALKNVHQVSL